MERKTRTSLICIGIDLAWSPRNPSGVAVLQCNSEPLEQLEGHLADVRTLQTNDEILAYIDQQISTVTAALIAVDAPLWVPNETGRRLAEAEITQRFRPYHAGSHPANRKLLAYDGVVRGEALVAALKRRGIVHAPEIEQGRLIKQVIEVFPHTAIVSIFKLNRILKYKAKPKRSWQERLDSWDQYQSHLRSLQQADPSLQGHDHLLLQDVSSLRGKSLKAYEDQVDALMCAYIALFGFRWGAARCQTFGTMTEGYIFTPVPESDP